MERYLNPELTAQERAEALADALTVDEQAGQLKHDAVAVPRLKLPAYNWWNEGLHGVARAGTATMFPQAIALASMFDEHLMRRVGEVISIEARAKYNVARKHGDTDIYKGLTLWSPNVNIFRDPRWGRGQETYGEDPYLTSRLGVEFVKGIQGEGKYLRAAACAKHYAVHSGPEALRHEFDAKATPKDLEETYLPAFRALVKAGVEGIMGAYNRINGEPSCASPQFMEKLREWGFDGYFVSDCWAIVDFHTSHMVTATAPESAAMALKAGCDINCGNTYLHILSALDMGLVDEEDIRRSCVRALRTRIRLGQLDETEYDDLGLESVATPEHKAFALECAEKSAVLLKNNGILPLDKNKVKTIAVIGPNADSRRALRGNYYGTPDRNVTFLEGIQDAFDGRVIYAAGCHLYKERVEELSRSDDRLSEALEAAEQADVIVACVGLDATIEGEQGDTGNSYAAGDKLTLYLPMSQHKLLQELKATGKPMVVVVSAGSSINVGIDPDALLNVWYSGQSGGTALARLLFGEVSPSGKLPVTFYKTVEGLPDFEDYSMKNRTYRYIENESDNVLFPFGFGLTYSRFELSNMSFDDNEVTVTVTNTGGRDAEDVVQLYIASDVDCAVKNHSLCGFERVALKAGESVELSVLLDESAFETVDEEGVRAVRPGKYTIYAGVCQPTELSEKLAGTKCVSVVVER